MKLPCRLFLPLLFIIAMVSCPMGPAQAQGIDVSKYQGKINWKKVSKSKKVKFVYIRATEGTTIKDPRYKANVDSARKHKIYVGSYHVYSSKTTAYQQFANFKSVVSKKKQDLIPVLDIEGHHSGNLNMAFQAYKAIASEFDPHGLKCYADMLVTGRGTERNIKEAFEQYEEAAECGDIESMFTMGEYYRNEGKRNIAAYWYGKAYARGYAPAETRLIQMAGD